MNFLINETEELHQQTLQNCKKDIRQGIVNAIEKKQDKKENKLSQQNYLINELIIEYLRFNNFNLTENVFVPESKNPPASILKRDFILKQMKMKEESPSDLPLLYMLAFGNKKQIQCDLSEYEAQDKGWLFKENHKFETGKNYEEIFKTENTLAERIFELDNLQSFQFVKKN